MSINSHENINYLSNYAIILLEFQIAASKMCNNFEFSPTFASNTRMSKINAQLLHLFVASTVFRALLFVQSLCSHTKQTMQQCNNAHK